MIDINELRQLAQAATPGPWTAKNVSGAGLEIHMRHPLYPDKEWPAFGTDSAFCKKGLVAYETWTQFPHEVRDVQQAKNASFIAAANPAAIIELLDRLEAAESAWKEVEKSCRDLTEKVIPNIREQLESAEEERDRYKLAYNDWITKTEWLRHEIACSSLPAKYLGMHRADAIKLEIDRLRAKIKAMEKQAPVGWLLDGDFYEVRQMSLYKDNEPLPGQTALYALPGAQGE